MALVRWLPQIAKATADDVARFGPNAARVRALLDFLPTMSEEAAETSKLAWDAGIMSRPFQDATVEASDLAGLLTSTNGIPRASARGAAWSRAANSMSRRPDIAPAAAAQEAAMVELISDIVSPETYRTLTGPLAAGRAVDLLRARPRNQGTPFLDVVRQAAERGAVTGPRDVVAANRLARSPEDIREIAMTLMADGMSAEEAMRTARML